MNVVRRLKAANALFELQKTSTSNRRIVLSSRKEIAAFCYISGGFMHEDQLGIE
jgi:hypothetical protein